MLGDEFRAARRDEPAADPRLQGRRLAGRHRRRAPAHRAPRRRRPRQHFERVQAGLDALGIDFELDPRLVRGFDYYTSTTFEFAEPGARRGAERDRRRRPLRPARRGDGRARPRPGSASGSGSSGSSSPATPRTPSPGPARPSTRSSSTGSATRAPPCWSPSCARPASRADRAYGGRSVKAQWKLADRSGARYGVMLGPREAERGTVGVKDLVSGEQVEVPREQVAGWILLARRGGRPMTATSMRTDRAGDLRVGDVDRAVALCGWVAGRRDHGGVVFLDLRDAAGIVQVVVDPDARDRARPRTASAPSTCCGSRGRSGHRPEGIDEPDLPTGEVEVAARTVEVLNRCRAAAVPDRRARRGRRGAPPPLPVPRPAVRAPATQPARCAPASTTRCARRSTSRASSRSRPRCSSRRRPKAPATSSCRRGCIPARSTRCRRARSCSSSC